MQITIEMVTISATLPLEAARPGQSLSALFRMRVCAVIRNFSSLQSDNQRPICRDLTTVNNLQRRHAFRSFELVPPVLRCAE